MPYRSLSQLPESVRVHIPPHAQEIYRQTFNNAWHTYADPRKRNGGSREETAHRVAWAAVASFYLRDAQGSWRDRRSA